MKKMLRLDRVMYAAALLLAIGFFVRLGADYFQIEQGLKFLPFSYYILGRSLVFLVPSAVCALLGKSYKKKL